MVDNTILNVGSGGDTIATDDIGGVKYEIVKAAFGALDTATLVTSSTGLPVGDAGGSLTVDAPIGTPVFIRKTAATFTTGQQALTTATQIVATNANRSRVTLVNTGTVDTYIGSSGVTTGNGILLVGIKGAMMVLYHDDAIYGVTSGASSTISYMEETTA